MRFVAFVMLMYVAAMALAEAPRVELAVDGKPRIPVVVSPKASKDVRAAAAMLADYLSRIAGGKFDVIDADGASGIVVGLAAEFPALAGDVPAAAFDPNLREDYLLRSNAKGVALIGVSDQAVEHAVWDFLYRLGYRQYFPGPTWEIVPKSPTLAIAIDDREHPAFYSRQIWSAYKWKDSDLFAVAAWNDRNRLGGGMRLKSGHAYGDIIAKNNAEFDQHPEYFALENGKRLVGPQSKFCISNPGLRKLVVDYAIKYFEADPSADCISVDPSDGGHWCECDECKKMGSVSDRVVTLANEVADAVNARFAKEHGDKYVGFYAYNVHSPPPTVKVHPKVIVSVATAFVQGGYTVDQLIDGWQKQGATIGMREYFSVGWWDRNFPRRGRASDLTYMTKTLPHFYEKGARYLTSQATNNWAPCGLGYYMAARVMWDLDEAKRVDAIVDEFLDKCFGPAKAPMREFYGLLNGGWSGSVSRPFSADFLGRMYRSLDAALKLTDDPAIRARIYDLAAYTRFAELSDAVQNGPADQQLAAIEQLIRWGYRNRDRLMADAIAVYRTRGWVRGADIPTELRWNSPAKDPQGNVVNAWKINPPVEIAELDQVIRSGVENNKLLDFDPVAFSEDLVSAKPLGLNAPAKPQLYTKTIRGTQNFYTLVEKPGDPIEITVAAGFNYATRGPAKLKLFAGDDKGLVDDDLEAGNAPASTALQEADIPPDQKDVKVTWRAPHAGLFRIELADRMMTSQPNWPAGQLMTMPASLTEFPAFNGRWAMCFYVPKGTQSVGGFSAGRGVIYDHAGNIAYTLPDRPGYFNVTVPHGQDGRLWSFESVGGRVSLMTVPPLMARNADEMLLPRDVVQRDARR